MVVEHFLQLVEEEEDHRPLEEEVDHQILVLAEPVMDLFVMVGEELLLVKVQEEELL